MRAEVIKRLGTFNRYSPGKNNGEIAGEPYFVAICCCCCCCSAMLINLLLLLSFIECLLSPPDHINFQGERSMLPQHHFFLFFTITFLHSQQVLTINILCNVMCACKFLFPCNIIPNQIIPFVVECTTNKKWNKSCKHQSQFIFFQLPKHAQHHKVACTIILWNKTLS